MRANCPWASAGGCRHFPFASLLPSVSVFAPRTVVDHVVRPRRCGVLSPANARRRRGDARRNDDGQSGRHGDVSAFAVRKSLFDLASVEIKKAPPLTAQFNRMLGRAGSDAKGGWRRPSGRCRNGLLPQFYTAVDRVLEVKASHPRPCSSDSSKAKLDAPLGDSSKQVAEMRALVGRDDMKVKESKHFILMHDTPDTLTRGRLTRADERIQASGNGL